MSDGGYYGSHSSSSTAGYYGSTGGVSYGSSGGSYSYGPTAAEWAYHHQQPPGGASSASANSYGAHQPRKREILLLGVVRSLFCCVLRFKRLFSIIFCFLLEFFCDKMLDFGREFLALKFSFISALPPPQQGVPLGRTLPRPPLGSQGAPLQPSGPIRLQPPGPYPAGATQYQQPSPVDASIGHQQRYAAPNSVYPVAAVPQNQLHPAAAVKREMPTPVFTFPPDSVEAKQLGPEVKRRKLVAKDIGMFFTFTSLDNKLHFLYGGGVFGGPCMGG